MIARVLSLALVGLSSLVIGCSSEKTAFALAMDQAETAREQRDLDGANQALELAAKKAETKLDRDEALYRKAHLKGERGDTEGEVRELIALIRLSPDGERTPRALLDLGRLYERNDHVPEARAAYAQVVTRYPNSGLALAAAERSAALSGEPKKVAYENLLKSHPDDELTPGLLYRLGVVQEEEKNTALALATYRKLIERYPLPDGIFSDEALLRVAKLELAEKHVEQALAALAPLINAQSSASMVGSYNRTTYVEARFLAGIILRDEQRAYETAEDILRSLIEVFPDSRLVDDAYFELAVTLRRANKSSEACSAMTELVELSPGSSFAKCEKLFCGGKSARAESCCKRLDDKQRQELCSAYPAP